MDNSSQYLQMFFDESAEYLQQLNENVLLLEENPEDEEIINAVFRAAHSMKGMSATMGFTVLTDLTHKIENVLSKVRNNELIIDENIINTLFAGIDYIKALVEDIKADGEEKTDTSEYLRILDSVLERDGVVITEQSSSSPRIGGKGFGKFAEKISLSREEEERIYSNLSPEENIYKIEVKLSEDCLLKNVRGFIVLKRAQDLGYLVKSNPDIEEIEDEEFGFSIYIKLISTLDEKTIADELLDIIDVDGVIIQAEEVKKKSKVLQKPKEDVLVDDKEESAPGIDEKEEKDTKKKQHRLNNIQVSPTVRVDIKKLDVLMNMVGELLINKTRLEGLNVDLEVYQDIIQQLDRVTQDLHHIVMQIRMVPIGGIFNRFPRMVRDLSKELNKEVDLLIEGAETELDRSIIDELADPLMHILRNAIDHGIETAEEREKKGKPVVGNILLQAYQKGSEIIIVVEDDGKGLELELITKKAIEKGIVNKEEVEKMDEREKLNLIFLPGFSTSDTVTDISGRGVGMDVVKQAIESLDGQVFIESEKDVGSRFTISLPLTLAITQALMVVVNNEVYAIPLSNISESHVISPDQILQVRGQDVMLLRDTTIPLVEAARQLNLNTEYGKYREKEEIPVVIIYSPDRQFGLIVDELLHQQEIVIKSLGKYFMNVKNISGATIVGDGEVALILDVRNIA